MAGITGTGSATGIDFGTISGSLSDALSTSEANITTLLGTAGTNPSTTDLLNLQVAIQQWTMVGTIQSTVVKDLSDSLKGIISKAS